MRINETILRIFEKFTYTKYAKNKMKGLEDVELDNMNDLEMMIEGEEDENEGESEESERDIE